MHTRFKTTAEIQVTIKITINNTTLIRTDTSGDTNFINRQIVTWCVKKASYEMPPINFITFFIIFIFIKSQSNFWLSFQKFLYAGIAYCYRLFRHFLLWKIFSNLLISPYVLVFKSSMWSSKFSVYYLCNQPLHFCYRRFGSRMRVIVQRHIDVGMSHDVLQCLWVHSCIC